MTWTVTCGKRQAALAHDDETRADTPTSANGNDKRALRPGPPELHASARGPDPSGTPKSSAVTSSNSNMQIWDAGEVGRGW